MSTASKPLAVLAMDDNPDDLTILERALRSVKGIELDFQSDVSPIAGIMKLGSFRPDVVCLDYNFGSCTGIEVLAKVRQAGYDGPILMLTGEGNEDLAVEALHAGVADYLPKGKISSEALSRSVFNAIEKWRLQREIEKYQSDLQKTNEDLRRREAEIQSFYHHLSHEMKTPLTVQKEYLTILLRGLLGPVCEEQQEFLETILDCCRDMVVYVNDLLDTARLETGKLRLDPLALDVETLARRVVSSMTPIGDEKGVTVSFEMGCDNATVQGDEHRVRQILTNLVNNALKFTPSGGEVIVRLAIADEADDGPPGGELLIAVRDTGCGIESEQQEHIFQRLYQVSEEDSGPALGGLGLGLNLCQRLVQLHDGRIWVDSEYGEGCTFFFTLPRCDVSKEEAQTAEELSGS